MSLGLPLTIGNNRALARLPALAGDGGGGGSGLLTAAVGGDGAEVSGVSPGVSTGDESLAQLAVGLAGTKGRGGSVLAASIIAAVGGVPTSVGDGDAAVIPEALSSV